MRYVGPRIESEAYVTGSFSFDAGTRPSVWWRAKSVRPVDRSTATAAEREAATCGTASARARRVAICGACGRAIAASTPPTARAIATTKTAMRRATRTV